MERALQQLIKMGLVLESAPDVFALAENIVSNKELRKRSVRT